MQEDTLKKMILERFIKALAYNGWLDKTFDTHKEFNEWFESQYKSILSEHEKRAMENIYFSMDDDSIRINEANKIKLDYL